MKFFNRFIPFFAALSIFIILEQSLRMPKQIYWLGSFCFLIVILSTWQLIGRKFFQRKFWQNLITPILFLASGLVFLSFLESAWLKQFIILILAISIWLFLFVIFFRFNLRSKYQVHSLENISSHLNLLTIFFCSSGFYGLLIFLGFPLRFLVFGFGVVCFLLTIQLIWDSDTTLAKDYPYLIVITLIITEMFLVVSFLPTSVYVNGFIVTISYYLIGGLSRNWLLGNKERKVVSRYLITSVITLIIILATAKWF